MSKNAAYDVITAGQTELPNAHDGIDKSFDINATSAQVTTASILAFTLHLSEPDDLQLQVWINDNAPVFSGTFNSNILHTVHAVVPPNQLKPSGNKVRFRKTGGDGTLRFSDVVFVYHTAA